jgi:DNA-binding MarR family transcriptional regulator
MARAKIGERRSNPAIRPVAGQRSTGLRSAMFRDVVMLLYATTGRLQQMKRVVASSVDLNSAEYSIVAALYRLGPKSGIRVRDIAKYLHMAPENVTTAVGRLVETKWVVKTIDTSDARAVTLSLHRSARQRIDRLTEELIDVNDIWFRDMGPAEINQLSKYLERILDGFDAAYQRAWEKFHSPLSRGHDLASWRRRHRHQGRGRGPRRSTIRQ